MDLTTSHHLNRPEAVADEDAAAALLDVEIRRAWAASEPRLLIVRVGTPEVQRSLLRQLHGHVQAAGGLALDAEANVLDVDGPYGPLVRALTAIAPQLQTETGALRTSIRNRLQQGIAPLGRLLVQLCPALEQVISTTAPLEELPCGFATERFAYMLVRAFAALAPPERPVAFFLREADLANASTLQSLSRILSHGETQQFVVVAFVDHRDKPQTQSAWNSFCTSTRYVVERFDVATASEPEQDGEPISGTFITRLSPQTRNAVMALACNGQSADVGAIAGALDTSVTTVDEQLRAAVEAGLLHRRDSTYAFHDARAARSWHDSMTPREAGQVHLRLGQWLSQRMPQKPLAGESFVLAAHLMWAVDSGVVDDLTKSERAALASAMAKAATEAMQLAAFEVALKILDRAVLMVSDSGDVWTSASEELARSIEFARFECVCAVADRPRAEALLTTLRSRAGAASAMPAAERAMVEMLARSGAFTAALEHASQQLAPLGIRLDATPSRQTLDAAIESVWDALGDRAIEEIAELDSMTNPQALAASEMLFAVHPCAQALGGGAADVVACHLSRLGLRHGNADASSVGYASFGAALIGRKRDHRGGYRFGKVATALCEQRGTYRHHIAVSMKFAAAMSIWTHPLQTSLDQCARVYSTAMISGNARAASRLSSMIALLTLLAGSPLDEVGDEATRRKRAIRSLGIDDEGMGELCDTIERFVAQQKGRTMPRKTTVEPSRMRLGHLACRVVELMGHVLNNELDVANADSAALGPALGEIGAQLIVPEYHFWAMMAACLSRTSGCPEGLDEVIDDFEKWSDRCPQTFQHKHALLVAERCRLQGQDLSAMRAYDQAISEARENGFTHVEAFASEVAARFYSGRDFATIATTYFRTARNSFARWGAPHKVAQLDRRFPKLVNVSTDLASTPPPPMRGSQDVDLFTAMKTAQAVSKEIVQQRLLVTLMRIVLEHGGAERCHVLLEEVDGDLNHAGKAAATTRGVDIEVPGPVAKHLGDILPASIIEHVRRTREPINLEDTASDREWADDPYIANTRPRSVLCFPIMRQNDLIGLFYLENNTARAAFTPRRLALLEFLATQASISLEHTKLYADLARENAERSRAEQILRKSEQTLRDKLEIIERQKKDIRTLSTPLLDVAENVVAMPILGELDEERASRIMDILLDTITKRTVRCAILDLTGVSKIEEATAEQIGRIVRAVELVGARAVVAGIRADVARAFIALNVGLGHVETRASMKEALRQLRTSRPSPKTSR